MKKIITWTLISILLVSMLPTNAFADHRHNYHHVTQSSDWVIAKCDCGESIFFDDVSEWLNFSEKQANDFCTGTGLKKNQKIDIDIRSLFSESVESTHPHAGYYETRDGNEVYLEKAFIGICEHCIKEVCRLYDKHSCLFDFEILDDYVEFECFCGKKIHVSYDRINDFLEDRDRANQSICENINFDLADEAYYDAKDVYNVTRTNDEFEEDEAPSTLSGNFNIDSGGVIVGDFSSNCNINKLKFYVTDVNNNIVRISDRSPDCLYVNDMTLVNSDLNIASLSTGTYILHLELSDESGTTGDGSIEFTLERNEPVESTLTIDFTSAPLTIAEDHFGLRGSVTSNYTLTGVYGYVFDASGNICLTSCDTPDSIFMDIRYSHLNDDLVFGRLSNGNYLMVVIAKDSSGAEVRLEQPFTVSRSTSSKSSSKENWTSVREWDGIIYYNDFVPGYYEVITANAEINDTAYDVGNTILSPEKGAVLQIVGKCSNKYNNIWYIVDVNGRRGYIYAGNVSIYSENDKDSKWKQFLDETSMILTVASFIPVADTITNIIEIPIDALRGDYVGVGLSAAAVIPVIGEVADTAKVADKGVDIAKTIDKGSDIAKAVDTIDDVIEETKITGFTFHGLAQVMGRDGGRGVSNRALIDTIHNPIKKVHQSSNGTTKIVGKDAVVVLNELGEVVTAYATNIAGVR